MTATIQAYFIDGDNVRSVPSSYEAAKQIACGHQIAVSTLRTSAKWEPLIEGIQSSLLPGWTRLGTLARTKRGIASGHNDFFLLSRSKVEDLGIQPQHHQACIGRSRDVKHFSFKCSDLAQLEKEGGKTRLLTFNGALNDAEEAYVKAGEAADVSKRFLLRQRSPWYTMERRPAAPIWALVFTRAGARFVRNEANALSLTNFHAVYPANDDPTFHDALACTLNSELVAQKAQAHWRRYGGGLTKFEPADLLDMPLPNLAQFNTATINELARLFRRIDELSRHGESLSSVQSAVSELLESAIRT